jgi:hypothetical protein
MTSADYIAKWKTYWRYRAVCSRLVFLSGVAAIVLAAWLHRTGCESLLGLLFVLFTACSIGIVIFYCTCRGPQKRLKDLGLVCPACGKPLLAQDGGPTVEAGCCEACGAQVLDSR